MSWVARFLEGTEKQEVQPDRFLGVDLTTDPPKDFVISRNLEGNILSTYANDGWDLSPYSLITKGIKYNFVSQFGKDKSVLSETALTIIEEMKRITFAVLYEPTHSGGQRNKPQTYSKLFTVLRGLAVIAVNENKTLSDLHKCSFALPKIIASLHASSSSFRKGETLRDLKTLIDYINEKYNTNLPTLVNQDQLNKILSASSRLRDSYTNNPSAQRTPLIPSRIYSELINLSTERIRDFNENSEKIAALLERIETEPWFFATPSMLKENAKTGSANSARLQEASHAYKAKHPSATRYDLPLVSEEDSVAEYGLIDFFERWPISARNSIGEVNKYTVRGIRKQLNNALDAARLLIYAYTGMRAHEVAALQRGCLSSIDIPGLGNMPIILCRSSKMTNSNYSESELPWATCCEVAPAVEACQSVVRMANCPNDFLFARADQPDRLKNFLNSNNHRQGFLSFLSNGSDALRVRESDIVELENFDAFRDWRNDKKLNLKVGEFFHIQNHQFRRSTAVYAARSGKVSLPSLKFQFKHLSEIMTMLYRENASFAVNILSAAKNSDSHGVIEDYHAELMFLEALDFEAHVIKSNDKLFGGAGGRLQQEKAKDPSWFKDFEEIKVRVRDGRISYRETAIGGCTSREMCDKFNLDEVIPCLAGCDDAILGGDDGLGLERGHKLKEYRGALKTELEYLDEDHPSAQLAREEISLINEKLIDMEVIDE